MHTRKIALISALVLGAMTSGLAQARGPDVQWSVNIGLPLPQVVVRLPVLLPPAVVVASPAPVYREVYRDVYQDVYRQPRRWDVDGDGIPNRYDSRYNPRWDRDGDGIPNRHDRHVDQRGHRDDRCDDRRDYRNHRDHRDHHDYRDDRRSWDGYRR